jgi:hypothetical protein
MLVLPDIYVLKTESIQKKTFSEDNLNKKLDEKNINNENFDKKFLIKIDDLDLPIRVLNFLKTENINYVGELIQYTEKDILSFPNSGRKSLQDIKYELSQINLTLGTKLDKETDLYKNIEEVDEYKIKHKLKEEQLKILITEIRNTNLSQRSVNGLLNIGCVQAADILKFQISDLKRMPNLGVSSIKEIELFLKDMNLEFNDELAPWNEEIIQECKVYFNNKKKNDYLNVKSYQNEKFLEEEILRVLSLTVNASARKNAVAKNKSLEILINRFGLDGSPPKTLEIIGQKFNVTRERIRQIIKSSLEKLKKLNPPTPILNNIFLIISDLLPLSEIELNKILKEKKITKQDWDFKGLQDFYETFDIKLDLNINKINNINFISKLNLEKIFNKIFNYINKKISNSGLFSLSECLNFKEVYLNNIKEEIINKIIQTKALFCWLDEEKNYFTYYSVRNRLSNLIQKAASTNIEVNIDNLFKKIKNNQRLKKKNPFLTKKIFISFCKVCFDCEIMNENIKFISPKSKLTDYDGYKGNIVAPNEKKLVEIFKKYGPILDWLNLKYLASKFGVTEPSLNMIMQFSVLFERIDKATYILANAKIDFKRIQTFKIDISNESFSIDQCIFIENENAYIEVFDFGEFKYKMNYPRPLIKVLDKYKGVNLDNRVFIIS